MSNPLDLIIDLRRRVNKNEDVSDEELREGIRLLHDFRNKNQPSGEAVAKKATKAAAKKVTAASAKSLLEDLL